MKFTIILTILLIAACVGRERVRNTTDEFMEGVRLAQLKNKKLREVSGMASSMNNPGLLWVHNDAGNKAEIYLLDQNLDVKLTCTLAGVENRDWEDIAIGPGPDSGRHYIYVGDIGDNDGQRRHKFVYRIEEPVWNKSDPTLAVTSIETITIELDDRPKDTETLLIDPGTKNLYLVSKRENPVHLYEVKYPYSTREPVVARKVMPLPMSEIVGGDFSHDGKEVVIKNYAYIYYWRRQPQELIQDVLKTSSREIQYMKEPQGEAITFAHDGSGLYTLSEVGKGNSVYLYFYQRKP
jgi:hypothetical protein